MTSSDDTAAGLLYRPRGERPFLLPFNRRLRHLHGISLRNLTLSSAPLRPRTRTFDDDAIPNSLSSPAKLLALSEDHRLSTSRSSSNLKSEQASGHGSAHTEPSDTNGHTVTPTGKARHRMLRRQSTLEWQNSSPRIRRRKVQDAIARHTADVFFSVHAEGLQDPLYVSEVVESTMNPDFRFFDLNIFSSFITRRNSLEIKFWARHEDDTSWTFLLDMPVDLQRLSCVGRSMENFSRPLPDNCVLFHLTDGVYASLPALRPNDSDTELLTLPTSSMALNVESTSSYDALMKLATLDACVQDALATQAKLATEIHTLVAGRRDYIAGPTELNIAKDSNSSTHRAVNMTKNQISKLKNQVSSLRQGIVSRREAMRTGRVSHAQYDSLLDDNEQSLDTSRALHAKMQDDIAGQRRRIVADLTAIYPIEPASQAKHGRQTSGTATPTTRRGGSPHPPPLAFTIRALNLPNSSFTQPHVSAPMAAAALGHVAHALALLSVYFGIPLPYPVQPHSSSSHVSDPISQLATPAAQRAFPLFLPPKYDTTAAAAGTATFDRFEYAVFLLNKDIEVLAGRAAALRVLDLRQTLPNLKYLLLVATAGRGELPGRKVGGVRGLLARPGALAAGAADGVLSGQSSRRGSDDSGAGEAGRAAEAVRRRLRAG